MITVRCSHNPSEESAASRAGSNLTFCGHLQSAADSYRIQQSCALDSDQTKTLSCLDAKQGQMSDNKLNIAYRLTTVRVPQETRP